MNNELNASSQPSLSRAQRSFARLMAYIANLYCMGGSSSVSAREMVQLTASVAYVLGIADATAEEAAGTLCTDDPVALWHDRLAVLDARIDAALATWRRIFLTMPPIRNIALCDTLASLGDLKLRYDTRCRTRSPLRHRLPAQRACRYELARHGLHRGLAPTARVRNALDRQFDIDSCINVLECACPDYRGLHVNLYDLLFAHKSELDLSDPDLP